MDLIFAETTPPGRGGVSVIRISGDGARDLADRLAGPLEQPRHAYFRAVRDAGEVLDRALVMWFPAGSSFTGEEVAELHLHGAPVVVRRVGDLLRAMGARPAEAGEFTKRAFTNGVLDLAEVEGLGDLLAAETEAQRRLAMRVAGGELGRRADEWRAILIRAGALVEVSVDFADEDVPSDIPDEVFVALSALRQELDQQISGYAAAEMIRTGFEVALIGAPNTGKSSLINRLSRREVAIVSDIAGTTRDVIEVRLDLAGLVVTMLDTAGLRETADQIEALGIDRAKQRARQADLRVHLSQDGMPDAELFEEGDIVLLNKADQRPKGEGVSAVTGAGVDALLDQLRDRLQDRVAAAGLISHQRQLSALVDARDHLEGIENLPVELVAESIRGCATSLDRLLGRIGAEDYLDVIFSSFCIGK